MKNKTKSIIDLINETIEILSRCQFNEQADLFREPLVVIKNNQRSSEEFQKALTEISKVLARMGSFSGLSLISHDKTYLTAAELRQRQWDLVKEINKAIEGIRKE